MCQPLKVPTLSVKIDVGLLQYNNQAPNKLKLIALQLIRI